MLAASIGAVIGPPAATVADSRPAISLEAEIPAQFGSWREERQHSVQLVNPQVQAKLDEIYGQTLERIYANADGYRIMLSVAYGADQRGSLKAHIPEFCYEGAGFTLKHHEGAQLETPFGTIPVARFVPSKANRSEPVTYWVMIGERAVQGWESKLLELSYTVTGRVPDGLVFRVSSIDLDRKRANRMQDQFVNDLMMSLSPAQRSRLSGLGDS